MDYNVTCSNCGKQYFYNPRTHRLHIKGYCKESNQLPYDVRFFASENEAIAFDGRSVGMCKNCLKKRERIQKEGNK